MHWHQSVQTHPVSPELSSLPLVSAQRSQQSYEVNSPMANSPRKQLYPQAQHLSHALDRWEKQVAELHYQTGQLQQALALETTLKQIIAALQEAQDETQILQTAVQQLAWALDVSCCAALYDLEQSDLDQSKLNQSDLAQIPAIAHQEFAGPASSYYSRVRAIAATSVSQQLQQGWTFQFCPIPTPASMPPQGTVVCCPLRDREAVLGDFWLVTGTAQGLTLQQIHLVEQVARQCAISLRQIQRYRAAQAQILELERLNQLKDDFLSTVSHELRAPLANIRLAIQLLEHSLTQGRAKCGAVAEQNAGCTKSLSYLKILRSECEEEISLINDLLDLQRLEAGRQVLTWEPIAIDRLILETVESFQERTQERQQTLCLDFLTRVPTVASDPNALHRILRELIHNACKYTPPGGRIQILAQVVDHRDAETCGSNAGLSSALIQVQSAFQLRVINHGIEIPTQELSRIFDKFYRVPYGDRWKQGGTGLGLALVKTLVTCLGGSIAVSSGAAQTCFTLELPLLTD